jgi:hypothetical protein
MTLHLVGVVFGVVVLAVWTTIVSSFISAWGAVADRHATPTPQPEPVQDVPAATMTGLHLLDPCAACPTRMAVPGTLLCTMCGAGSIAALPALIPAALPADDDWAKLR